MLFKLCTLYHHHHQGEMNSGRVLLAYTQYVTNQHYVFNDITINCDVNSPLSVTSHTCDYNQRSCERHGGLFNEA